MILEQIYIELISHNNSRKVLTQIDKLIFYKRALYDKPY